MVAKNVAILFGCLMLPLTSLPTNAAVVIYSGSSSADYASGPVSNISLSFVAEAFDDSVVTGIGSELFEVGLQSLVFSPDPLGSTTFSTSNAAFQAHYVNGNLFALRVGGIANGVEGIGAGDDDFMARFTAAGDPFQTSYRLATSSSLDGNSFNMTGSVSAATVPEPSAMFLLSAIGAVRLRRCRHRNATGGAKPRLSA